MSSKRVNIVDNANEVRVTNSNKKIEIVDTNVPSNIEIVHPISTVVEVKSQGPQGPIGPGGVVGPPGPIGPAGPGSIFEEIDDSLYFTTSSLQITGSVITTDIIETPSFLINRELQSLPIFLVKVADVEKLKINGDGTFIINESTELPDGENGAVAVSGSNFFIFL